MTKQETKQQKDKLKQKLKGNKKTMMKLLYPKDDWTWGNEKGTVEFMNILLKDVPEGLWPEDKEDFFIIKDGNWRLDLMWTDGKQAANLIYLKDDHTAWVIKRGKKFVDFDIGGS